MTLYYYQAIKHIEPTALIQLFKNKILFKKQDTTSVFETQGTIYLTTSRKDIMEEIENLYPGVFKPCIMPLGAAENIIFTIG